jgi:hypothetical protein
LLDGPVVIQREPNSLVERQQLGLGGEFRG